MKRYGKAGVWVLLGLVFVIAGCNKKTTDQAGLTSSPAGFDSMTTEELAQLPQASSASSQQSSVEALPIETSPVTQAPAASVTPSEKKDPKDRLEHNKQIQTALKNVGLYNGTIDGKLGPASHRAIETFQKNNGLKVDGKVGPKTWVALEAYLNGPVATPTQTTTPSN